jgi:hypothetical protein
MSVSPESQVFAEQASPYPIEVRQAWTEVLISCWNEDSSDYINALRSEPLQKLLGDPIIDGSEGKYFPLPSKPPEGVPNPADSPEKEEELRRILKEDFPHFGQMMMGGGWPDNAVETWVAIIIRAWKDPGFLQSLRVNPVEALKNDYPEIGTSLGKYFPISEELPKDLEGLSEDEVRKKLNDPDSAYMGWMMTCCR